MTFGAPYQGTIGAQGALMITKAEDVYMHVVTISQVPHAYSGWIVPLVVGGT